MGKSVLFKAKKAWLKIRLKGENMHIGILKYAEQERYLGRIIASNTLVDAIQKYSSGHEITLIAPEENLDKTVKKTLQENPLDVLFYPNPSLYRAMFFKTWNAKPLVVTGLTHSLGHEPYLEWLHMNMLAGPSDGDAMICTSDCAIEAIREMQTTIKSKHNNLPLLNLVQAPLGINCNSFYRSKGDDRKHINLTYIGRLCPYTKVDLVPLLRMFKEILKKSTKPLMLNIAGEDSVGYKTYLGNKAKEFEIANNVIISGNLPDEFKRNLLSRTDIFLAPSNGTQETFGLSILEANASGVPVVAYDWSGYRSLIKNGKNGFLIETTLHTDKYMLPPYQFDAINQINFSSSVSVDEDKFISTVLCLIEENDLRAYMSDQAFRVASEYDFEKVIPQYFKIWELLCSKNTQNNFRISTLDYYKIFSKYATHTLND